MQTLILLLGMLTGIVCLPQSSQAQLHNSYGLSAEYSGTVAPPALSRNAAYYSGGQPGQMIAPVSDQIYLPPTAPQQVFQPAPGGMPAAPPATTLPPQAMKPNYLPLPGGYTIPDVSPQPEAWQHSGMPAATDYSAGYCLPEGDLRQGIDFDYMAHCAEMTYQWTLLPKDLLWQSYAGGPREPRLASSIVHLDGTGWLWELEAGGRAGLLRYGAGAGQDLEGWQLDIWGGAFPRLNFEHELELDAADFKVGVPLTWKRGPLQFKFEWYHISSHLGDEFLLRPENTGYNRLDYLRDSLVLGIGYFLTPDVRVYAEADYAYNTNGGAEPWHFQFGLDYAPICTTLIRKPVPFFAINGNLREEVNYSGGVNVVAGLQWRGEETQHTFRTGLHYYAGQSLQLSFLGDYEEFLGWGMWLDF